LTNFESDPICVHLSSASDSPKLLGQSTANNDVSMRHRLQIRGNPGNTFLSILRNLVFERRPLHARHVFHLLCILHACILKKNENPSFFSALLPLPHIRNAIFNFCVVLICCCSVAPIRCTKRSTPMVHLLGKLVELFPGEICQLVWLPVQFPLLVCDEPYGECWLPLWCQPLLCMRYVIPPLFLMPLSGFELLFQSNICCVETSAQ
jgi:hypothetical protein